MNVNHSDRYRKPHRRSRLRFHRRKAPPGASPGTLVADPDASPPEIHAIAYGPERVEEREISVPEEVRGLVGTEPVLWVNVNGLGDPEVLERVGGVFDAHGLLLEDAVNMGQRAKAERFDEQLFIVLRMPIAGRGGTEQVSMLLGKGFLLTMQELPGDLFEPVRERVRQATGRLRSRGADYLAYALIDAVVDGYFPVLEEAGDELDALEDEVFDGPDQDTLARLHGLKRELVNLRKAIWPHREMLAVLMREGEELIEEDTRNYLRDAYDHVVRIIDLAEALREVASDLLNTYLTMVSNRMNEVMKVLTVVATIFIPLGFVAGVYGMNFNTSVSRWNMPELSWAFGYPAVLLFMLAAAVGMLLFMRHRRWL
ncbi:MAG: magnesium/cobalt transporter CorA [Candidatus Palauibacterales bacterium]|nr:magnesium/cobalt transporter CorA [Candidatus Palauibacterales bacterium]MDP2483827.1 magnesium/cobalt transporter CorA [Candidatus Palauibacterales bacterium]